MGLFNDLSGIDEIGVIGEIDNYLLYNDGMFWIQNADANRPRTIWFQKDRDLTINPLFKSQWVPMKAEEHKAYSYTGPFQSLLSREPISFAWMKAYSKYGKMVPFKQYDESLEAPGSAWTLWVWVSNYKPRKAFMICHHCGVLPDLKKQLWFLGIQADFYWLSDGKGPTGGLWPSHFGEFTSSVDILKGPIGAPKYMIDEIKERYDIVVTSHCMRYALHFLETGLPLIHINSTRFGNEITTDPLQFKDLCARIGSAVKLGQLQVIHNNLGDKWYFEQYFEFSAPVIPSLCTSPLRFRIKDETAPYLIWDTRFHITDKKGSKTLIELSERLGSRAQSTSELCCKKGSYLDDDLLNGFRAVIHIPYNISTMSCFEQAAGNVPIWIPSPKFLEKILEEYSELSWYCFGGDRETAEPADQFWNPATIHEFVSRSDFTQFKNVLFFDSIEDIVERIDTVNYDALIKESFLYQTQKRLKVLNSYSLVLDGTSVF